MAEKIRVLIVDDQAVVRHGLSLFLNLQDDICVVAEAADGIEAIEKAAEVEPEVVLMDLVLPRLDGIAAIRGVRERCPEAKVLVLTSFADDDKLFPALQAGAAGYLMKDVEPEQLANAIRTVHRGDPLLHPEIMRRLMQRFAGAGGAPEGTVTILFTDIESSTPLVEQLGDERSRELFREHDQLLRGVFKKHGGLEVKHQGDGFMLAFSGARRALRCAIEMQRALAQHEAEHPDGALRVRMGLNTGEAIAEESDYFGQAVILASRIASMARGGEILVSDVTRTLVGANGARFVDRGEHELKGLRGSHHLYGVDWKEGPVSVGAD